MNKKQIGLSLVLADFGSSVTCRSRSHGEPRARLKWTDAGTIG